jgi:histidyl-tRNA synthetase
VRNAPPAVDYLSEKSRSHFARVQDVLKMGLLKMGTVPFSAFSVDPTLVRGFDYYTDTLWEVTAGGLGAQNALGGGGRYDNLVETLGGRPTPGVGFGSGLERLLLALDAQGVQFPSDTRPLVWLVSLGDQARDANLSLLRELRASDIAADMDVGSRGAKGQLKLADRDGAAYAVIQGETELAAGTVVLKDLKTTEQTTLPRGEVVAKLKSLIDH